MRMQDPGIGLVTILGVRLSPDFNQARVILFRARFGPKKRGSGR